VLFFIAGMLVVGFMRPMLDSLSPERGLANPLVCVGAVYAVPVCGVFYALHASLPFIGAISCARGAAIYALCLYLINFFAAVELRLQIQQQD
jgi:hypothetical protein